MWQKFWKYTFKLIMEKSSLGICYGIALRWMPWDLINGKLTLAQVMDWCCQVTSYYISQSWPRSMLQMTSIGHNELTNLTNGIPSDQPVQTAKYTCKNGDICIEGCLCKVQASTIIIAYDDHNQAMYQVWSLSNQWVMWRWSRYQFYK